MQLTQIQTDADGRETTERGTPLFPLSVHDNDMQQFAAHFVPWHWHEEFEFVVVTEGTMALGYSGGETSLPTGAGAFLNSNALHTMRSADQEPCRMITVDFDPTVIGGASPGAISSRYVQPLIRNTGLPVLVFTDETVWGQRILQLLSDIAGAESEKKFGYELRIRSYLSEIWLYVLENMQIDAGDNGFETDPYIRQLLAYVHANYADNLTLEDIARSAGISCRTCSRSFRQHLRMSVFAYLTDYRIGRAAELLSAGDMPITEICFACGFNDPSYFTRRFRKATGMAPKEYRKASRAVQCVT